MVILEGALLTVDKGGGSFYGSKCQDLYFLQSCLSLLLVSFSASSAHVSHWPDHYVVNACIALIKSPLPT